DVAVAAKLFDAIQKIDWQDFQTQFQFSGSITDLFNTQAGLARIQPLAYYSLLQCEEAFCDFLGLRLFGESYLQAQAYMLAPNWPGERPLHYPSERQRAEYLVHVATAAGIAVPAGYVDLFVERPAPA